jgi:hypothetical protein
LNEWISIQEPKLSEAKKLEIGYITIGPI